MPFVLGNLELPSSSQLQHGACIHGVFRYLLSYLRLLSVCQELLCVFVLTFLALFIRPPLQFVADVARTKIVACI